MVDYSMMLVIIFKQNFLFYFLKKVSYGANQNYGETWLESNDMDTTASGIASGLGGLQHPQFSIF